MAQLSSRSGRRKRAFWPTLRRLRQAQKSAKGAPPYSLYINRPLGRIFAAAAYQIGLTPNQVTWIERGLHLRRDRR